jgi:acyl-CoA thioesterase-2
MVREPTLSDPAEIDRPKLPEVLRLEPLGDQVWRAPHEHSADDIMRNVVFGGQILGQMIVAAALEGDGTKEVKSIHVIFARAGDYGSPLDYVVEPIHRGRTFASDRIDARQNGRSIASGLILWNLDEPDIVTHTANVEMPDVPPPEDPAGREDNRVFPGAMARICFGINTWSDEEPLRPAVQNVWTRVPVSFPDPVVNQAILSWATDGFLIGTALLPHEGVNESHAHKTISTGVVSHTVNFHERFDASEWLLIAHESVWAGRGRSHGRANVWTQSGKLVASFTQDNIVREFSDGNDHTGDYARIM